MAHPTGHTKPQKEMARKRTVSGMSKAKETGVLCSTFISYVFWNPTYKELQGVAHLPAGMEMPDVNSFLQEFFTEGGTRAQRKRRRNTRRQGPREEKVVEEIVVDPAQSDASMEDQIPQADAKLANPDISPTRVDPDTTGYNSPRISQTSSSLQTALGSMLAANEDAAADWDVVDPTDETHAASGGSLISVYGMSAELVDRIAGESEESRALGEELNRQLEVLGKGLETCRRFAGLRIGGVLRLFSPSGGVEGCAVFQGEAGQHISRLAGFFAESAEAAIELVESASMVIEVICGKVAEVMERLQYDCYEGRAVGTASATAGSDDKPQIQGPDPSKFPKTFDRIHLSNIPDYVGGPLNPFLFARPLLKPLPDVSVCFNNLLNCTSFADMDQFNAEYTLLPNESLISKQFQLKRQLSPPGVHGFVQEDYMKWDLVPPTGRPLPFEKLPMSRPQLEKWLHAWFLKICLPYPRGQRDGYAIHSPFNLTVLLRLMAQLHEVAGYPAHWVAGILRTLCSDSVTTTARPPVRLITTVADLSKTYPPKKMNVSPYNAELTTLPQDVVECKVLFKGGFKGDDGLRMSRFMILLWNKSLLGKPPASLRGLLSCEDANSAKILEKKGMHVVSTFAYSVPAQTASFWLRTDVVDRVMEDSKNTPGDGWVVYIWRTDSWAAQSQAVKVKDCLVKGRKWTYL
ncbi:hypothetical protein QBC37DRAFT_378517 [Rhypophila decipiens]|uniref:Uncharacterized protein n=1 Tax=Rhypophila decipiens TaxID=261697 RepID=A0AAN6Y0I8_9PEZI|nr:hypothetical protein QBC37DRAFT_378517 [Rhypophila decipiens]